MRIVSGFRDYYDYVEYMYNPQGGDSNLTWDRNRVKCFATVKGYIPSYPSPLFKFLNYGLPSRRSEPSYKNWEEFPWRYKICVVCGKLYLLAKRASYKVNREGMDVSQTCDIKGFKLVGHDHESWNHVNRNDFYRSVGTLTNTSERLCMHLKSPVILIHSWENYNAPGGSYISKFILHNQVPTLEQLGFGSIIPAEQMYQDISMYLGKFLDNPDSQLPSQVADKDRFVQKGFDSKVSFRGKVR